MGVTGEAPKGGASLEYSLSCGVGLIFQAELGHVDGVCCRGGTQGRQGSSEDHKCRPDALTCAARV